MSIPSLEKVRADFDRIALLQSQQVERAEPYDAFLLQRIPASCVNVLEIGCGTGRFAKAIADRGAVVVGIDASTEMIRRARERAGDDPRVRFLCTDLFSYAIDAPRFDCVLSIATLHHLPAATALATIKALLKPNGVLVLHDLRAPAGTMDWLRSAVVALVQGDAWWWLRRRLREKSDLRRAWREHGAQEQYLTLSAVRALCDMHLPGARIHWHPLWRYTIVWSRTDAASNQVEAMGRRVRSTLEEA